jgi:hypothetical protein
MLTFEKRVLGGNSLQWSGSGSEPDPEPTWDVEPVANTGRYRWTNYIDQMTFAKSGSLSRGEGVVGLNIFGFNGRHSLIFGAVFILHILHKGLLVLGSIRCLVYRTDILRLVPHPKWSQFSERSKYMCWNETHMGRWSDFRIIDGQLLPCNLHKEV